jgi:hypothetical protein
MCHLLLDADETVERVPILMDRQNLVHLHLVDQGHLIQMQVGNEHDLRVGLNIPEALDAATIVDLGLNSDLGWLQLSRDHFVIDLFVLRIELRRHVIEGEAALTVTRTIHYLIGKLQACEVERANVSIWDHDGITPITFPGIGNAVDVSLSVEHKHILFSVDRTGENGQLRLLRFELTSPAFAFLSSRLLQQELNIEWDLRCFTDRHKIIAVSCHVDQ